MSTESEIVLIGREDKTEDKDLWICNTGTSCHMTGSLEGLIEMEDINQQVILEDGRSLVARKMGNLKSKVAENDADVTLMNVKLSLDSV